MRKTLKSKKNGKRGFTLAETLVALLILLMVTSVVAAGIPAASSAYRKVVDSANAQVLVSTTVTALRNQIEFAKDVSNDDDKEVIVYTSSTDGTKSSISNSDNGVILTEYINYEGGGGTERLLVSDKAATNDLFLKYDSVTCSNGIVTFTNLSVAKKSSADNVLASIPYLKFSLLSLG